jgi:hypothetical protein
MKKRQKFATLFKEFDQNRFINKYHALSVKFICFGSEKDFIPCNFN